MRMIATCFITAALVLPAHAVTVSNLDEVSHYVVFEETMGSKVMREVTPGQTIQSQAVGGAAYLKSKPDQSVRIEEMDRLAIWPGGNLQIQMRMRRWGQN